MSCQRCQSNNILDIMGKCSDCCSYSVANGKEKQGYVPFHPNIRGGDFLEFKVCLDCGQMQGQFPMVLNDD